MTDIENNQTKAPSEKQREYLNKLRDAGAHFDNDAYNDAEFASMVINVNRELIMAPPTEKQLAFLQKLQKAGAEIPEKVFKTAEYASEYISKYLKKADKNKINSRRFKK